MEASTSFGLRFKVSFIIIIIIIIMVEILSFIYHHHHHHHCLNPNITKV